MQVEIESDSASGWKTDFQKYLNEMHGERNKIDAKHLLQLNEFYLSNALKKKLTLMNIREMQQQEVIEQVNINVTEAREEYSNATEPQSQNTPPPSADTATNYYKLNL